MTGRNNIWEKTLFLRGERSLKYGS
jgi:hypothetical protein